MKLSLRLVALVCAVYSCKSSTAPIADCWSAGVKQVSIGVGTQPSFTWSSCAVSAVTVTESSIIKWSVASRDKDAIAPPVQYGVKPPHADTEYVAPSAL